MRWLSGLGLVLKAVSGPSCIVYMLAVLGVIENRFLEMINWCVVESGRS